MKKKHTHTENFYHWKFKYATRRAELSKWQMKATERLKKKYEMMGTES